MNATTIATWYQRQRNGPVWEVMSGLPEGVESNGPILFVPRFSERLAGFTRYGSNAVVWLGIPNRAIGVPLYRLVRDALLAEGAPVVAVPLNVLGAAEVQFDSIEMIDTRHAPDHLAQGDEYLFSADVGHRTARFLSGYDENEPTGSGYFMCELPSTARPTTVAEAYEALKPEAVKQAERHGIEVRRQGDMFFIRMETYPSIRPVTPEPVKPEPVKPEPVRVLTAQGGVFTLHWTNAPVFTPLFSTGGDLGGKYLHNTNHVAEHIRREGGLTFASGNVMHAPRFRAPDHQPLHLDTDWWLCVKNTVPTVR